MPALARVGLAERAEDKVRSYSMGMRQRLGVAACLLGDPELLILDEPMNGLDPAGMQEMRSMIESLVEEGRTVVLSSHLLDEVERTCDAVAIVDRGRVIRQGPIEDLVRGANAVVEVECSDPPGSGPHHRGRRDRLEHRRRGAPARRHAVAGVDVSDGGRDRAPARRGRDLPLRASRAAGVARRLVLVRDEQARRGR